MPLWLLLAAGLAADTARSVQIPVARGESLHVVTFGHGGGEPVVLIPGFFGSAFSFRKVVPLLAQAGYQPIVVEPLGTGFSSRPEHGDYSLSAQARRIAATLDSLHVRHAWVIGHALGGAMAWRFDDTRPALVADLVSLAGGPPAAVVTPE